MNTAAASRGDGGPQALMFRSINIRAGPASYSRGRNLVVDLVDS